MVRLQSPDPRPGDAAGNGEPALALGVIASPGPAADLAAGLVPGLADLITARLPGVRWEIRFIADRLVERPADLNQLVSAARRRLLADGLQLVVCLTDLPLQTQRRPVVAHASPTHGVAVLSLPALGAVAVSRRASDAIVRLVAALLGDADAVGRGGNDALRRHRLATARRARELGARVRPDEHGLGLVAGVVTGNLRLLLGMLRANRPWRLAIRLSRAIVAAAAAAVFALVTSDIWRLAGNLGSLRLSLLTVGSVLAVVLTIVVGAGLWERAPAQPGAREQVILFNMVTAATVVIGVLALYLALFVLSLLGVVLLVPNGPLGSVLGHPVVLVDRLELGWLASSVATVGGALGAGLETDEAVREAAYGYQPDEQLSRG